MHPLLSVDVHVGSSRLRLRDVYSSAVVDFGVAAAVINFKPLEAITLIRAKRRYGV